MKNNNIVIADIKQTLFSLLDEKNKKTDDNSSSWKIRNKSARHNTTPRNKYINNREGLT
jgi:hypothetical protein